MSGKIGERKRAEIISLLISLAIAIACAVLAHKFRLSSAGALAILIIVILIVVVVAPALILTLRQRPRRREGMSGFSMRLPLLQLAGIAFVLLGLWLGRWEAEQPAIFQTLVPQFLFSFGLVLACLPLLLTLEKRWGGPG